MKRIYVVFWITISMLTISNSSFSQQWVEMMKDPNANFYETQAAFESYWAGKTIQKGKGYKAFKRWEHHMAPRVYPSGNVTLPSQNYKNYKQWEADLAAAGIPKSTNGNWSIIGPIGKPTGGGAGRLNFIRFDPTNSNTIWVGAPDGGLWWDIMDNKHRSINRNWGLGCGYRSNEYSNYVFSNRRFRWR